MPAKYDFCGWATKNDIVCSDGRVIRKDAFKDCDGKIVPMIWNHQHDDPDAVLGHALLKNVPDKGVIAYGSFNNTEKGQHAKELVSHGDIVSLSIYANHLRQNGPDVVHGQIREVSLVLAGANPGAFIETVLTHADGTDDEEEGVIRCGIEGLELNHADVDDDEADENGEGASDSDEKEDDETVEDVLETLNEKQRNAVAYLMTQAIKHGDDSSEENMSHADEDNSDETVGDVFDTLSDKQKKAAYALIEDALHSDTKSDEEDDTNMKHNLFEGGKTAETNYISHADQEKIMAAAKAKGSFRDTLNDYLSENVLQHGDADTAAASGYTEEALKFLFPEYKDTRPGAPELVTYDQGWVNVVMNKTHKMPFSRIRSRQTDIRTISALRAKGYDKGKKKALTGNYGLIHRTTDPQTIYVKSALNRDDIMDITDFDYVAYQYSIDRLMLNEEVATAIMLGDGRDADTDADKISPDHIRPIWTDDELYTIHKDIDVEAMAAELQGTDTASYFGESFIYAEAIVTALLYARENYKGTGRPDFFCDPHLLNVMLLSRDRNGHRVYSDVSDVAKALNVGNIYTVEQFAGKVRTSGTGVTAKQHKLLGIMVNLDDYKVGATRGGQITHFTQFDIDFNQEKSLLETRISGALDRIKSAIVLEEPVTTTSGGSSTDDTDSTNP